MDWMVVHETLVGLARKKAAHELEEGRWLLAGLRARVHEHLGMGSYAEYLHRHFGYEPREVAERLRVARALEALPEMAAALGEGELCYSAVRELTRVATHKTEGEWLRVARDKTVRQVEKMVRGREPGNGPSDPAHESARTHVLRFEVDAETYALWREAVAAVRREAGGSVSEDEALGLIARQVLGGPKDEGRAPYQIALTVCEGCGQGWQDGRGEPIAVDEVVVEKAACDAQHIDLGHIELETHVGAPRKRASQSIPPATRRLVLRRDHGQCVVDGCCAGTFLDVHHLDPRAEGGSDDADRLATLCGAHHRAVHEGRLLIEGDAAAGLSFFHADGTRYGSRHIAPAALDASAQAFSALRHMGFRETPSRQAIAQAVAHVGRDAGLEALVRAALATLS